MPVINDRQMDLAKQPPNISRIWYPFSLQLQFLAPLAIAILMRIIIPTKIIAWSLVHHGVTCIIYFPFSLFLSLFNLSECPFNYDNTFPPSHWKVLHLWSWVACLQALTLCWWILRAVRRTSGGPDTRSQWDEASCVYRTYYRVLN